MGRLASYMEEGPFSGYVSWFAEISSTPNTRRSVKDVFWNPPWAEQGAEQGCGPLGAQSHTVVLWHWVEQPPGSLASSVTSSEALLVPVRCYPGADSSSSAVDRFTRLCTLYGDS